MAAYHRPLISQLDCDKVAQLSFPFNFAVGEILECALTDCEYADVELLPGIRNRDTEYADDIALMCEGSQGDQNVLVRVVATIPQSGMALHLPGARYCCKICMIPRLPSPLLVESWE
ncbi:hypothetical protein AHF37_12485 [Paragonimus kellicotti]|nr:hypothetical protein AHF37_12485 [Paragonimus kellicotti]